MDVSGRAYSVVANATEQLEVCLGNIRLLAGMMIDDPQSLDREQRRDYLRTIERKARHLLSVTADLGDFAQLGLREPSLSRDEIRLSEIAEQALEAITPLATSQRRMLLLAVGAREPSLSGDYRKLLQALTGLLRHCLEIAIPAAQILIKVGTSENVLRVEIDVPFDHTSPSTRTKGTPLCDTFMAEGYELAVPLAAQVFELHGGSLRTLTAERHRRFVGELPLSR